VLANDALPVDAMVLEAVYPDIERAVANCLRNRFGRLGALAAPALIAAGESVTGLDSERLQPIAPIGGVAFLARHLRPSR